MALLEVVARAAAAAAAGDSRSLDSGAVILSLKPGSDDSAAGVSSIVRRVEGWAIQESDAAIADLAAKFSKKLRRRLLKKSRSQDPDEFFKLLHPFLKKSMDAAGLLPSQQPELSGVDFVRSALSKLRFVLGEELLCLILEGCVEFGVREVFETLVSEKFVRSLSSTCVVDRLIDKNEAELICLLATETSDLRASEINSILKFFLSPTRNALEGMAPVRKMWESEGLLAVEKATQKGLDWKVLKAAREASALLMVAHDGFTTPELGLHCLFGSSNLDGFVLSSAISGLGGAEVVGLLRYLVKWLRKYRDFPGAVPCSSASSGLPLRAIKHVPSLESVTMAMGLVLNEHFSYLALNTAIHDELKALEEVVEALAMEAKLCCSVTDIIKHLQLEYKKS